MAILSTKLNKTQKMSVVEKCNEEGISVCEYIRQLIQKDLEKTREERFEASGQNVHMAEQRLSDKTSVDQMVDEREETENMVSEKKLTELEKFVIMLKKAGEESEDES